MAVQEALATSVRPAEKFIAQVYDVVRGHTQDTFIEKAVELFGIPYKRDTLTAFLLSRATPSQIEKGTDIKKEIFSIFEKLFVDPDQFEDKMDLHMFGHFYRDHVCQKENIMQIEKALTDGPYALLGYWAGGNEINVIPDEDVAAKLLGIALEKVAAAAQASLLSPQAKEGLRWAQFAIKALDTRNKLNPTPTDSDELMLELEKDVVTDSIGTPFVGFDLDHLLN